MKQCSCKCLLCQFALVCSFLAQFLIRLGKALAPSPTHFSLPTPILYHSLPFHSPPYGKVLQSASLKLGSAMHILITSYHRSKSSTSTCFFCSIQNPALLYSVYIYISFSHGNCNYRCFTSQQNGEKSHEQIDSNAVLVGSNWVQQRIHFPCMRLTV